MTSPSGRAFVESLNDVKSCQLLERTVHCQSLRFLQMETNHGPVTVSPWAENVFRSVMSKFKWNLRVKRVNADTRRMARSALTRNGQP